MRPALAKCDVPNPISKSSEKELYKFTDTGYKRVSKAIDNLAENPRPTGVKKLKGNHSYFRKRMSDYRIGVGVENDEIVLYGFLHRKDMYLYFP